MSHFVKIFCWYSIALLWFTGEAAAQFRSNKGKEFWLGYAHNFYFNDPDGNFINGQILVLYLTAERPTKVTVSVNGTTWSQTVTVPGKGVDATIEIPKTGLADARLLTEGKSSRGIHIVAEDSIVAYAHQYGVQSSAAMQLFPVEAFGYSYTSVIYTQRFIQQAEAKVWTVVVASEDNTRLEITPSENTGGGRLKGVPFTIDLNKGETYQLFGEVDAQRHSRDLTGTKAKSVEGSDGKCHPFAMYAGSSIIRLCDGDGGEFMWQQMFPISAWGSSYLTYKTVHPKGTIFQPYLNLYRIIVADTTTIVKRNGTPLTGLVKGSYYEINTTTGDFIEANEPIMVTQYMPGSNQCLGVIDRNAYGDPEMFTLTPIQQGIKSAIFYNTRRQNIDLNYFDLIIHNNGLSSLRVNGATVPASFVTPHPQNSNYSVVVYRLLGAGKHNTVSSDSVFYAKVYGYGGFESYGYNLGTMINNLNGIFSIQNVYSSTNTGNPFTCPFSPFKLSVRLSYRATSIRWEFSKTTGFSTTTDTILNNPTPVDSVLIGDRKYFTYTLPSEYHALDTGIINIPVFAAAPDVDYCEKTEPLIYQLDVRKGPQSDFTTQYSGCLSDTARFTGSPTTNGLTLDRFIWTHYDGQVDSAQNSKKKFPIGDHPVSYQVIANNGCLHDTTKIFTTPTAPIAKFGSDKLSICLGDSVLLSDSSTYAGGPISQWSWNFGNGQTASKTDSLPFFFKFTSAGSYRVNLAVNTVNNCQSDSTVKTINVNNRPTATFSVSGKNCVDSSMLFTSNATGNGSTIQQWNWDFGNGQIVSAINANPQAFTYSTPGAGKTVLHWVNTGGGCVSDTAKSAIFQIFDNPKGYFRVTADSFCVNTAISFADSGSTADITSWQWNFGNGTGTQPPPFARTYTAAGSYTATLQVSNANGCHSLPYSSTIQIFAGPVIDAGPDIIIPKGQQATLQANGPTAANIAYSWSPANDLNNPATLRPVASPTETTTYLLTGIANGSCVSTDTMRLTILTDVFVPTAFSPNGDGLNDVWNIPGLAGYINSRLSIYDRYGQIIFSSTGYSRPWDGTKAGKQLPAGVYYYLLDIGDGSPRRNGSVTLLR